MTAFISVYVVLRFFGEDNAVYSSKVVEKFCSMHNVYDKTEELRLIRLINGELKAWLPALNHFMSDDILARCANLNCAVILCVLYSERVPRYFDTYAKSVSYYKSIFEGVMYDYEQGMEVEQLSQVYDMDISQNLVDCLIWWKEEMKPKQSEMAETRKLSVENRALGLDVGLNVLRNDV